MLNSLLLISILVSVWAIWQISLLFTYFIFNLYVSLHFYRFNAHYGTFLHGGTNCGFGFFFFFFALCVHHTYILESSIESETFTFSFGKLALLHCSTDDVYIFYRFKAHCLGHYCMGWYDKPCFWVFYVFSCVSHIHFLEFYRICNFNDVFWKIDGVLFERQWCLHICLDLIHISGTLLHGVLYTNCGFGFFLSSMCITHPFWKVL